MTPHRRTPVTSIDEVVTRHGCIAVAKDPRSLPEVVPHTAVAVVTDNCVPLGASLQELAQIVRGGWEFVEIYARPHPTETESGEISLVPYQPLTGLHFGFEGWWIAVLRYRHPSNEPRVVGIMLAKDEADVIPDVVHGLLKSGLQALYYTACDEATAAAIHTTSPAGWARAVPHTTGRQTDGCRQSLLDTARADRIDEGDPRPTWIVVAQGDEIYHDDFHRHIMLAQAERATVMTCQVATFLLHESQRDLPTEHWQRSLGDRLDHYVWDFGEHAAFLDFPWAHYNVDEHMRAHPHGTWPSKYASARPVRKHYPFRSPVQAEQRVADRLKSGWQPHYENYRQIFMGAEAAGRPVKKFHGWFGEAERTEGIW